MILLDTNYIILSLIPQSPEWTQIRHWRNTGERLITSSVVWYEFVSGPVNTQQQVAVRNLLSDVLPFDTGQSEKAAELWNAAGRRRELRIDAMIAAAAVQSGSALATNNQKDFELFESHGLKLL